MKRRVWLICIICWSLAMMIWFSSFIFNWPESSWRFLMGAIGAIPIGVGIGIGLAKVEKRQ